MTIIALLSIQETHYGRNCVLFILSMYTTGLLSIVMTALFSVVRGLATKTLSMVDKRACFGAGCYWGTEKFFKNDFGKKHFQGLGSVTSGKVGFMGPEGAKAFPSYKEVCTGTTQQVEVYDLTFDGDEKTYEALVKHFFMFHDPTTIDRQVNDKGTQYASTIFVYDAKQREIAQKVKAELQEHVAAGKVPQYVGKSVVTNIQDATVFYPAHEEHQEYLDKNPEGYCNHFYRIKQWPSGN